MQILDLAPNTPEWLEVRLDCFCASEAPAMMNESKFMTRNQLLALKKGWQSNPVDSFKQQLFDKGHEHEDAGRQIAEMYLLCDLPPVVGSATVAGMTLLASFDGYPATDFVWEHKSWNNILAENVRNGVLEPLYYWQLEHQMLVADVEKAVFSVSDGTSQNYISMNYYSQPDLRKQLVMGWAQFAKDLDEYEIEARQEVIVAKEAEALPALSYHVENGVVVHSLNEYLPAIKDRAAAETSRILETEQDFADKDKFNKATKTARSKLKEAVESVQGEFISFSNFALIAAEIDVILQKMQSAGETQVKTEREKKKKLIMETAAKSLSDYLLACGQKITPMNLSQIVLFNADFVFALKGLRIGSWQNAADQEVARVKIEIDAVMDRVLPNLEYLREHAEEYKFLFSDAQQLVNQEAEPFQAIVKSRIADHKQVEADKAEEQRLIQVQTDEQVETWTNAVNEAAESDDLEDIKILIECVEADLYKISPDISGDHYNKVRVSHQGAMTALIARKNDLEKAAAELDQTQINRVDENSKQQTALADKEEYDNQQKNEPDKDPLGFPVETEGNDHEQLAKEGLSMLGRVIEQKPAVEQRTLTGDLAVWADNWSLPLRATEDLENILKAYGIEL